MAEQQRKIQFYLLSMVAADNTFLPIESMQERIMNVISSNMIEIDGTSHRATSIALNDGNYVIELLEQKNNMLFFKLGIQNVANSVALRNVETLTTDVVPMRPGQNLETFTYCLLDLDNGVVSYVNIPSAPRLSILRDLFKEKLEEAHIKPILSVIYSRDVYSAFARKQRITRLDLDVAVPPDRILSGELGLSENEFDDLRGERSSIVTYTISASRNQSIHHDSNHIADILRGLLRKLDVDHIKRLTVSGKDDVDTAAQNFDILKGSITMSSKINKMEYDFAAEKRRLEIIHEVYNARKDEILHNIT